MGGAADPPKFNDRLCRLALMLSLAAAGCVSSAPLRTAQRAVNAAKKGRLTQFQSELTGRARSTIGTEQGMDAIRQKLAPDRRERHPLDELHWRIPRLPFGRPQGVLLGRQDRERARKPSRMMPPL